MPVYEMSAAGSVKVPRVNHQSMNAGNQFGAMVPIASADMGGSNSAYFTNIPQTYQDLLAVYHTRNIQNASGVAQMWCWLNGTQDTANGLCSFTTLTGNGSAVNTGRNTSTNQIEIGQSPNLNSTAGVFGVGQVHILNYTSTSTFKTLLSRGSADLSNSGITELSVGLFRSTAAVTALYFRADGGATQVAGSTVSLYGIRASNS